jgi:hypothetical protein
VEIVFVSMVWILFMLGTYLYWKERMKAAGSNAADEERSERTDDESSSMEMRSMGEKGESVKVEVVHIEEKS